MIPITIVNEGNMIKSSSLSYSPDIFSLNYAVTAFEGLRYYSSQSGNFIFRLEEHVDRLIKSAEHLGFDTERYSKKYIIDEIINCIKINKGEDLYIRPIFFYESGIMSLSNPPNTNFTVFAFEHKSKVSPDIVSLEISEHRRETNSINKKISKNYYDSFIALKNKSNDYDDVLLLSPEGYVTETSAHNIFFITSENEVITPDIKFCLEGITRNTAIFFLKKNNIKVSEKAIKREELNSCIIAAFTTSTASEIRIIRNIDSLLLDINQPIIVKLVSDFHSFLKENHKTDKANLDWKTYV